jgi:hypothetical protein
VVGRSYFSRSAATLLKFAKSTNNRTLRRFLIEKAADLKSQVDETMPPIRGPLAPDVEPADRSAAV